MAYLDVILTTTYKTSAVLHSITHIFLSLDPFMGISGVLIQRLPSVLTYDVYFWKYDMQW